MRIFMTGGTGFVGTTLSRDLAGKGHIVTILTRPGEVIPAAAEPAMINFLTGDPTLKGKWQDEAARHDVFINLAGASIFSRWTEKTKKRIRESRIATTRNLVEALSRGGGSTKTLLSTSAVGYYGFHGDDTLKEDDPPGTDFLSTVARDWEQAAMKAVDYGSRVVICRFGIVLGRNGGALSQLLPLFKRWLGSPLGNGRQWFSWVHEKDLAAVYAFLLEREDIEGPINCSAPNPVRNRELTQALAEALEKPVILPSVPSFVLRALLGEFGNVLLKGQRVFPERLLERGFIFSFPTIQEALRDILS
ncbi:MAG: TIGR01777 family oxidoreductase [Deltaproteobacteria bacterium]|nr:TIGR01777 family oxidoreductase [Deltaproteobacteria bacterium]